jgi:hypothetical protein
VNHGAWFVVRGSCFTVREPSGVEPSVEPSVEPGDIEPGDIEPGDIEPGDIGHDPRTMALGARTVD